MPVIMDFEMDDIHCIENGLWPMDTMSPQYRRYLFPTAVQHEKYQFVAMLLDFEGIDRDLTFKQRIAVYQLTQETQ